MKRIPLLHVILIVIAALTSACKSNETDELSTNKGEKTINFCVANYKQYPMDDVTRSVSAEALDNLSMTVFDTDGNVSKQRMQTKGDTGYGNFSIELPYGTYTFVFFGYNGSRQVEISSPTNIHFVDGYAPNCFYRVLTLTINADTQSTQSIVLERPVACFTLRCETEKIPVNLSQIIYTVEGVGTSLDCLTGLAPKSESRQGKIDFSIDINKKNTDINIYSFLPTNECTATFIIKALDNNDNIMKTRTFTNVPLKINQRTYYTGDFFADDEDSADNACMGFTVSLENEINTWSNNITITY